MKAYPFAVGYGLGCVAVADLTLWRNAAKSHSYRSGPVRGAPGITLPPDPYHGDETIKVTKRLVRAETRQTRTPIEPGRDLVTDIKHIRAGFVPSQRRKP